GTNAHVVLEEAPASLPPESAAGPFLLLLSARTPGALAEATQRLAAHLDAQASIDLADVAYTLANGRKGFAQRAAWVVSDRADALRQLAESRVAATTHGSASGVVFLFPGQGAQYAGMGRELHRAEPAFRAGLDTCAELLAGELGFDLRERLFADDADGLIETRVTQPATFAIEYAL